MTVVAEESMITKDKNEPGLTDLSLGQKKETNT